MRFLKSAAALLVFTAAMVAFPPGSDASLASDGIWYGIDLQKDPARSIRGNHPLFHLAAWPVASGLDALGVPNPGHWAVRVVSATGAAVLVATIASLAGSSWIGLAAAAWIIAARTFLIESGTGENVVPAIAAALLAIQSALRHRRRALRAGILLGLAIALRQDNVFLVPGILLVLRPWGSGGVLAPRVLRGAAFLIAVALPVLAVYVIAWRLAAPERPLVSYVLGLGAEGAWSGAGAGARALVTEGDAIAMAIVGRHWSPADDRPLLGLAGLLLPVIVLASRRGLARLSWEPWLFGLPIVLRAAFYGWFEPRNPEWQLFAIAFSTAFAARLARLGSPLRWAPVRTLLLLAAAIAVLATHLPRTLALRKPGFREAVLTAVAAAPRGAVLVVEGFAAPAMPAFLGLEATIVQGSSADNLAKLQQIVAAHPGRAVLAITDRFVLDSMPWTIEHRAQHRGELDGYPDTERTRMIRREGLAYAMVILPPASGR